MLITNKYDFYTLSIDENLAIKQKLCSTVGIYTYVIISYGKKWLLLFFN